MKLGGRPVRPGNRQVSQIKHVGRNGSRGHAPAHFWAELLTRGRAVASPLACSRALPMLCLCRYLIGARSCTLRILGREFLFWGEGKTPSSSIRLVRCPRIALTPRFLSSWHSRTCKLLRKHLEMTSLSPEIVQNVE